MDFAGQTLFEKMDEGVQYFVNPLRNQDEDQLENIKALNARLAKLRIERKELHYKKTSLIRSNRNKLEKIREMRSIIDEFDD